MRSIKLLLYQSLSIIKVLETGRQIKLVTYIYYCEIYVAKMTLLKYIYVTY